MVELNPDRLFFKEKIPGLTAANRAGSLFINGFPEKNLQCKKKERKEKRLT